MPFRAEVRTVDLKAGGSRYPLKIRLTNVGYYASLRKLGTRAEGLANPSGSQDGEQQSGGTMKCGVTR